MTSKRRLRRPRCFRNRTWSGIEACLYPRASLMTNTRRWFDAVSESASSGIATAAPRAATASDDCLDRGDFTLGPPGTRTQIPQVKSLVLDPVELTARAGTDAKPLVAEVAPRGEDHRHARPVAGVDHLGVALGAARLDDRSDAGLDRVLAGRRRRGRRRPRPGPPRRGRCPRRGPSRPRCRTESTRLIWPAPTPAVARSLASTIAFERTCLHTRIANSSSPHSALGGLALGDHLHVERGPRARCRGPAPARRRARA